MTSTNPKRNIVMGIILATLAFAAAAELTPEVQDIQTQWAQVNYKMTGDQRKKAMHGLVERCEALKPSAVEGLIWCGIVNSTYAGIASPLSAMKYAKAAKKLFEKAIEIDDAALAGSAYTSLGTLYFKVPGWPLGFGDSDEAETLLKRGLSINAEGIDSNYFYADYLYEQGDFEAARKYLAIASAATPREGREVADAGRQAEIEILMAKVEEELAD